MDSKRSTSALFALHISSRAASSLPSLRSICAPCGAREVRVRQPEHGPGCSVAKPSRTHSFTALVKHTAQVPPPRQPSRSCGVDQEAHARRCGYELRIVGLGSPTASISSSRSSRSSSLVLLMIFSISGHRRKARTYAAPLPSPRLGAFLRAFNVRSFICPESVKAYAMQALA